VSWINQSGKDIDYIVNVVQHSLYEVPADVVASKLEEFTTGLPRRSATSREARVCLLRIQERRAQKLVISVKKRLLPREH